MGIPRGLQAAVSGAYLRGDVVLTRGERMIRAAELYYDFENDRALILDAVMRAMAPDRDMPIYVRAKQVRQLSTTEYFARKAMITTSEFHTPHVHIGAERVYLTDMTPRDEARPRSPNFEAGRYRAYDATLNVEGVPVSYWPYSGRRLPADGIADQERALRLQRRLRGHLPVEVVPVQPAGLEKPQGVDGHPPAGLLQQARARRRASISTTRPRTRYGLFRGYYIHDTGKDNLGPFRDGTMPA